MSFLKLGKPLSEEHKKNIGLALKGKKRPKFSEEWINNIKIGHKGQVPWNKGKTDYYSKEALESNRQKHLGRTPWNKGLTKEKIKIYYKNGGLNPPSNLGNHHSEETKKKIGLAHKGMKTKQNSGSFKKGDISWNKGKNMSEETKIKIKEARAKQIFPMKDTSIELKIQNFLTQLHMEYLAHKYISEITNKYQCDIFIPVQEGILQKTIIECDGDYWHGNINTEFKNRKLTERVLKQIENDKLRTKELQEQGFRVIRLWGSEIKIMELNELHSELIK